MVVNEPQTSKNSVLVSVSFALSLAILHKVLSKNENYSICVNLEKRNKLKQGLLQHCS